MYMNLDNTIQKWQGKIDELLQENRLKLLLTLSERANTLLFDSTLVFARKNTNVNFFSKLIFRHKHFDWILSHESNGIGTMATISIELYITRKTLFKWSTNGVLIEQEKRYTKEDLSMLSELINPLSEYIVTAASEIQTAFKQHTLERLQQDFTQVVIEEVVQNSYGTPEFILSNGMKMSAQSQYIDIKENEVKKLMGERDFYGRIIHQ